MHYTVLRPLLSGDFTYQDMGLLDRAHIHFFTYNEIMRMFLRAGYYIDHWHSMTSRDLSEEDRQFVEEVKKIGHGEEFFYLAYHYLVVAGWSQEENG